MAELLTMGEMMLRLSPKGKKRFLQANELEAIYGGGEANVAIQLAAFGLDAGYITKLPENDLGQAAVNELRKYGVDTSTVIRGGDRIGIYFLEHGASQRPSKVIYDRANSAIAQAEPEEFDWDAMFADASWFHCSGITPALGENAKQFTLDAVKSAKAHGVRVSCDLNYRKKLWTVEEAGRAMREIMPYVDVLIANQEQVKDLFGYQAVSAEIKEPEIDYSGCRDLCKQLTAEWANLSHIAMTLRGSVSGDENYFGAMLYDGLDYAISKNHLIRMVDRVGSGDAFSAGMIYALHQGYEPQRAVNFAVASGTLKHAIEGDVSMLSVDEVEALAGGEGSGKVQR